MTAKRNGSGRAAAIEVEAIVAQVKTMADGGIRVAFDLPETAVMQAAQFMECKRGGAVLILSAHVLQREKNGKDKVNSRSSKNPLGMAGG